MTWPDDEVSRHTKPFVEHLEDLRRALLIALICLGVGVAVVIPLAPFLLRLLSDPVAKAGLDPGRFLQPIRVTSGFSVAMRLIFWAGVLVSFPGTVCAAAWFVFPGLTRRERRVALAAGGLAAMLFAGGVALGYRLLPLSLRWLIGFNAWMGLQSQWVDLADYVSFCLRLLVAFGMACELPVLVLALGWLGLVSSSALRRYRRHAVVGILTLSAALTPPDVLSQILLAIPMAGLYEACLWILRWKERRSPQVHEEAE